MICKKSFRQLLLMILSLITLMSGAGCGTEKKTEAIENQNVKGEFIPPDIRNGVYKKTEIDGRVKSYNYTGEIEFMHDKSIYMYGSPFRYDTFYENGIPKTIPTSIADVINYYWGYSVVDIGGKDYISLRQTSFVSSAEILRNKERILNKQKSI